MSHTARQLTITTTAVAAALLLTACGSHQPEPLEHGTVKKKHHDAETKTPIYQDRYRETNCRSVTTNALTLTGISRPSTTGGSGGRSSTTGGGGVSKVKPGTPNKVGKGNSNGSSGGSGGGGSRRVCDRQYLGRVQTGVHKTPEAWKVLIVKGDRSRWKPVTEAKWRTIKVGDRI
ncbi:hypothetical protein OG883_43645 [Streptomyces sp. NBC_01142]|uniref:hypothetical protein n=1 Tax=Streptomyces sp. NBC_01142 TaxID=2975865 RepID=UPI0022553228|nr:hypothetical protein [Streptomyces sp. NBC_01142]MCX4826535.1 hypothetical protein [Streptomyces sp. NBC_01142]